MKFKSSELINQFLITNNNFCKTNFATTGNYFDFIFLCGKSILNSNVSNRHLIKNLILKDRYCFYAENITSKYFKEFDLLKSETILNDLSSAILIILESYGTACELGAFTFLDENKNKIWVINNRKYEKEPSFIRDGPIKRIKDIHDNRVFYTNFDNFIYDKDLIKWIQNIPKTSTLSQYPYKNDGLETLKIFNLQFLLFLIYDYTRLFKILIISDFIKNIRDFFKCKNISIELSSKAQINDEIEIETMIELISMMLVESELFYRKRNKKVVYYSINYNLMKEKFGKNKFTNVIFQKKFIKSQKTVKKLSAIYTRLKKDGFKLWIQ